MTAIRPAAVAGAFYPADRQELTAMVSHLLAACTNAEPAPKAIIAPHAGYIYSGPIAASVYARVANGRDTIRRVVLLGPSHRVPLRGIALSSAAAFATPLGPVAVDQEAIRRLQTLPQVIISDDAHRLEHSLEVHLPFLQMCLTDFQLVPMVVGEATAEEVNEVLEMLWGGPETLIVVSSDLSHYHDYATAQRLDLNTSNAIASLRPADIGYEQACGRNPILGLLSAVKHHGMRAEIIDVRNSGDTAGPREQVVGYGAYAFH